MTSGSMSQRIKGMFNSPRGRDLMRMGRREAAKPATRQKVQQLMSRVTGGSNRGR